MERNYVLDINKIHAAYIALRNFYNAPSSNDKKELDILYDKKAVLSSDEFDVFYDCMQWAYLQGRDDGYRATLDDEDIDV